MPNVRKTDDGNLIEISISTILSDKTKEGKINFGLKEGDAEFVTQWDLAKAKHIRDMLTEAIEAAISDTLIFKFLVEKVGLDEQKAAMALLDFRELRQGTRGIYWPH